MFYQNSDGFRLDEGFLPLRAVDNDVEYVLDEPQELTVVVSLVFHVVREQIDEVELPELDDRHCELLVEIVLMVPESFHQGLQAREGEHRLNVFLLQLQLRVLDQLY